MDEILGLQTSQEIWRSLELAYSHDSQERMQNLKDYLTQLQKVSSIVSEFGRKFKVVCD